MINVVHVITELDVGGAEMMLHRLVSAMDDRRFRNEVVSLSSIGPVGKMIAELGVPVSALGLRPGTPSPAALWRLSRLLRRRRAQVVQTWLYHADLVGLLAARLAGTRHVVWNLRCSNMELSRYRRATRWVVKVCSRLSSMPSAVIVNSRAGHRYHADLGYRPKRWELIPNGLDLRHFQPDQAARGRLLTALGLSEHATLIGLVARFDPMKDHRTFLEAASVLRRKRPEARFVLIGRGADSSNPELAGWVRNLGVTEAVHLLGERLDVPALVAGLDVASLSSAFGEGFPSVLAEAMACGVPCVATDVGDAAEVVGNTGRIVPPRTPDALAAAWLELLEMGPEEQRDLRSLARRRAEDQFALAATVERYERLYEELAG